MMCRHPKTLSFRLLHCYTRRNTPCGLLMVKLYNCGELRELHLDDELMECSALKVTSIHPSPQSSHCPSCARATRSVGARRCRRRCPKWTWCQGQCTNQRAPPMEFWNVRVSKDTMCIQRHFGQKDFLLEYPNGAHSRKSLPLMTLERVGPKLNHSKFTNLFQNQPKSTWSS